MGTNFHAEKILFVKSVSKIGDLKEYLAPDSLLGQDLAIILIASNIRVSHHYSYKQCISYYSDHEGGEEGVEKNDCCNRGKSSLRWWWGGGVVSRVNIL